MSARGGIQSIEPNIADLANGWLKAYKLDYKLEQESLNNAIDTALYDYYSKNGGVGGNRPDAKLLLKDKNLTYYPILIEYKGYKDKLIKLDNNGRIDNKDDEPDYKVMRKLISAIQKLIIKEVVVYTDNKKGTKVKNNSLT